MKMYPYYLLSISLITFQNFPVQICQLYDPMPTFLRVRLPAVVSFDGVEDLFLQMYDSKLKSYQDAPDLTSVISEGVKQLDLNPFNAKLKVEMCRYIINSDYFKLKRVKHADPRRWLVRWELRQQNEIFTELWKPSDVRTLMGGYENKYENLFRTRPISTKRDKQDDERTDPPKEDEKKNDKGKAPLEPKEEKPKVFATDKVNVFSCVVRHPDGNFQLYYVSEDYNMNAASSKSPHAYPIAGRFIFVPNEQNQLVVHAITQESTRSLAEKRKVSIEYVYLEKKLTHATVGNPAEDPICRLNMSQRLRLCSAIFSMKEFKHKYQFLSLPENLQTDCQKLRISYRSRAVRRKVGGKTNFEEWTFTCRPFLSRRTLAGVLGETNENIVPRTFHISRGYVNDRVFVHRERGGRIYPEWFLYSTGVLDDVPKPEPPKTEEKKEEKKEEEEKEKNKEEKEEKKKEKEEKEEGEEKKPKAKIEYYPDGGPFSAWFYPYDHLLVDHPHDQDNHSSSSSGISY